MIGFALCHGWAFNSDALQPLAGQLRQRFPGTALALWDIGFTGQPHTPLLDSRYQWIAIGHSYGFAYLIQQNIDWHAAISINGFTRFCQHPGYCHGLSPRIIDSMLNHLCMDMPATLSAFYMRCGITSEQATERSQKNYFDKKNLIHHLRCMRDLDIPPPTRPLLALFSDDDKVVPAALVHENFGNTPHVLRNLAGDHALPLKSSDICAHEIIQFVKHLPI